MILRPWGQFAHLNFSDWRWSIFADGPNRKSHWHLHWIYEISNSKIFISESETFRWFILGSRDYRLFFGYFHKKSSSLGDRSQYFIWTEHGSFFQILNTSHPAPPHHIQSIPHNHDVTECNVLPRILVWPSGPVVGSRGWRSMMDAKAVSFLIFPSNSAHCILQSTPLSAQNCRFGSGCCRQKVINIHSLHQPAHHPLYTIYSAITIRMVANEWRKEYDPTIEDSYTYSTPYPSPTRPIWLYIFSFLNPMRFCGR